MFSGPRNGNPLRAFTLVPSSGRSGPLNNQRHSNNAVFPTPFLPETSVILFNCSKETDFRLRKFWTLKLVNTTNWILYLGISVLSLRLWYVNYTNNLPIS